MDVKKIRKLAGLTQEDFWSRIGIEQSVGCRYEKGTHPVPECVVTLLTLAYGDAKRSARMLGMLRGGRAY